LSPFTYKPVNIITNFSQLVHNSRGIMSEIDGKSYLLKLGIDASMKSYYYMYEFILARCSGMEVTMQYKDNARSQSIDAIFNEYDSICRDIAKSQGLSGSCYDVLRTILMLGEDCSQTEVYQNGFFNKQTTNSAVKKLIEQDILTVKAGKGRENKLFFTEKGKSLVERSVLPFERAENEVYDEFTEDEYQMLLHLAKQYVKSLKNRVEKIIGGINNE